MSMIEEKPLNTRSVARMFKHELTAAYVRKTENRDLKVGIPHAALVLSDDWCPRRHVLGCLYPAEANQPPKPSAEWEQKRHLTFEHGWIIHEKLQRILRDFGGAIRVVVDENGTPELDTTHYDSERMVYYSPDLIVDFLSRRYIVEYKGYKNIDDPEKQATYQYEFFEQVDEWESPPLKAYLQANFYCHLYGAGQGVVAVEGKNTQELKVWAFSYNREDALPYVQRCYDFKGALRVAHDALQRHNVLKLPERVCETCNDTPAKRCPMKDLCFGLEE